MQWFGALCGCLNLRHQWRCGLGGLLGALLVGVCVGCFWGRRQRLSCRLGICGAHLPLLCARSVDAFAKKEWFDIKAPNVFPIRQIGKTLASKTQGNRLVRDNLMNRVVEVSLGDLKPNGEDDAFRKFKLKYVACFVVRAARAARTATERVEGKFIATVLFARRVEEVAGTNCLTNFYGMDLTTDKLRSLVRKWHSLVEAWTDIKTTDGYMYRLFCIGFTKRRPNQSASRKGCYAQSAQLKTIRRKMVEIMQREATGVDQTELVAKLIPEIIGKDIEKATQVQGVGVFSCGRLGIW